MNHTQRFDIKPEYQALGRSLADLLMTGHAVGRSARTVIAVAGESGSGKSITAVTLAHELAALGIAVAVLHQDNYFIRPPRTNHEHRTHDLGSVGAHEVNWSLVRAHIAAFRAGATHVAAPLVDYPGNRFLTQHLDFSTANTLIMEGTYALQLDDADIRIFLDATSDDTRERRHRRNRDIDAPIVDHVLAIEHALIAPQAERAHIVIDRDFHIRRRNI